MKRLFLFFIIFLIYSGIYSQLTIKISSIPQYYTPLLDTIFIAGTFNNWAPANSAYRMIPQIDGSYSININSTSGSLIEYKFTRGSWNSVETQLNGTDIPNRSLVYSDGSTVSVQIENWKDQLGWHSSVGNTKILDLDFYMPQLQRSRRIWIYLPHDYFSMLSKHYPVLYMQDGQNLFDNVYAPFGEWTVDESMDSLGTVFSPSAIIVGIDHGGNDRINEYSTWFNSQYGGGEGEVYADFVVNTLKPFIDSHFRSLPERDYTGIMGSSMGGLISFYTATKYQNVFSKAGIFSPSFWFSDSVYTFVNTQGHQNNMKYYFLAGEQESTDMIPDIQNVKTSMLSHGFASSEMTVVTKADGQHSEWFWSREFADAYKWLFNGVTSVENLESSTIFSSIEFYPENKKMRIENGQHDFLNLEILDMQGRYILKKYFKGDEFFDLSSLSKGLYIVSVCNIRHKIQKKIVIY